MKKRTLFIDERTGQKTFTQQLKTSEIERKRYFLGGNFSNFPIAFPENANGFDLLPPLQFANLINNTTNYLVR